MGWRMLNQDNWLSEKETLVRATTDARIGDPILAFDTVMFGAQSFAIHDGPLTVDGDFVPPADNVLIAGDLTVTGKIATEDADAERYYAALIVLGSVRSNAVFNGEGCLFLITGDCVVCAWFFGPIMDASVLIGGDFVTPIFFGSDIWADVGGTTAFDHGDGYTKPLDTFFTGFVPGTAVYANRPIIEGLTLLELDTNAPKWSYDHLVALEERLMDTGSILPDHGGVSLELPENTPDRSARALFCQSMDGPRG